MLNAHTGWVRSLCMFDLLGCVTMTVPGAMWFVIVGCCFVVVLSCLVVCAGCFSCLLFGGFPSVACFSRADAGSGPEIGTA